MKFTFGFAGLLVGLSTLLTACGGNPEVQEDQCDPEVPYSTGIMRYEWSETEALFWDCINSANSSYGYCGDQAGDDPDFQAACVQTYDWANHSCRYYYELQLNKTPLRECGAVIYVIPPGISPQNYTGGISSEEDTDGDGISNYMEFLIGLNPCEAYSEGECSVGDAAWDYDKDDLPNGQDPVPNCNPKDPNYAGECV